MPSFTIKIRENASLFITPEDAAQLQLVDHAGNEIPLPPGKGIALCRCGASKRKPFCDASHKLIGWDGTLNPAPAAAPATPVPVSPPPAPEPPPAA